MSNLYNKSQTVTSCTVLFLYLFIIETKINKTITMSYIRIQIVILHLDVEVWIKFLEKKTNKSFKQNSENKFWAPFA